MSYTPQTISRPRSAVNNGINFLGLALAALALYYCRDKGISALPAALVAVGVYAGCILGLEMLLLRTPWNASAGFDFHQKNPWFTKRYFIKLLGVYGTWSFVILLYWLFPEYHGTYYNVYWDALGFVGPWFTLLTVPYVLFTDRWMKAPEDSYYWFGRLLLLDWKPVPKRMLVQHVLCWVVKGFFLPLMFVGFCGNINHLMQVSFEQAFANFVAFFDFALFVLFTIDLIGAVAGYVMAFRLTDTHFRSAEPTLFGWIICIICYQPLQSVVMRFYMPNNGGDTVWMSWFEPDSVLYYAWGSTALLLLVIYSLATISFGCRFSNLTHRGILTNGFYRFTKHPAYVSKNLFWWMTSITFVPMHGLEAAIRNSALLALVSGVYYLRARTEENHLSHDPVYVRYALWMNEHSMFSNLGKLLPFLRYKPPVGWETLPESYQGLK